MPSQYGKRQQSKWLHYLKTYVQKWKVYKKKNLSLVWGVYRKKKYVPREHSLASRGKPRDARQWSSGRISSIHPHTNDRCLCYSHETSPLSLNAAPNDKTIKPKKTQKKRATI